MNLSTAGLDPLSYASTPTKLIVKTFPRLYKKTNTGAIQYWDVFAQQKDVPSETEVGTFLVTGEVVTMYGQLGTASPQRTVDVIREGKNPGKKNATTAYQQAEKEAEAKWKKQKKKGYVESEQAARDQEVDAELVTGGLFPMLAQSFAKHGKKIKWPAYIQPKFDGIRCIAIVSNGKATLWSRTRKPITSLPHIVAALEESFTDIILDGELYNHKFRTNFEEIVSLVRQEEPAEGYENVEYHIYDMVSDKIFADRNDDLTAALATCMSSYLQPVQTGMVENEEQVSEFFVGVRNQGFEGAMLRNGDGLYEQNKRSYGLQKVKEFEDAEFDIVGVEEGRGRLQGHVGAFVCRTSDGKEFLAKMSGSLSGLKEYFDNPTLWAGKKLTVQYQGFTGAAGVPRFPVGLRIRAEE